ncbi:hypothetical protein XENOCAPTIV_014803, partial [Xenoophorus captivus]
GHWEDDLHHFEHAEEPSFKVLRACRLSVASNVIFTLYNAVTVFVLTPLFTLILYMGFQRWRHQRFSPAGMTISNTDFFTYNMMFVEVFAVVGSAVYSLGNFIEDEAVLMLGVILSSIIMPGQTLFHLLTCVERYLAVVHPIAYMHLKEAIRVRIRNISSILVWLLSIGWMWLTQWYYPAFPIEPLFSLLGVCILVMLLCCVFVLCALVRPGPGQEGGRKKPADQSKKRAFQMIMAITGTLNSRSAGLLFWLGLINYESFDVMFYCVLIDLGMWLMVPSSLVLPLLFLHRAGKLSCNKQANESG